MPVSASLRALLLSSSRVGDLGYLEYARPVIADFLGTSVASVLFVPYAIVTRSWDDYLGVVRPPLREIGLEVNGIHRSQDPADAVARAAAIVVGGGNTWRLVRELHERALMEPIRTAARRGVPYVGWSAGANVACPTFQTTNDMPICDPLGFETLGLVPFQINPHYLHGSPPGFHGETREDRIREYLEMHPRKTVVGLREGTLLRVERGAIRFVGRETCRVFRRGEEPRELGEGDDLQFLLQDAAP
jgi:dipeptidase E